MKIIQSLLFVFLVSFIIGTIIYTYQPPDARVFECVTDGGKPLFEKNTNGIIGRSGQPKVIYSYYRCEK